MPTEKPTWSVLESKVREIYSIPSSVSPGLTYSDVEGDMITISSQTELDDYYKQASCHDNATYKFSLVIFTSIRDYDDGNENNGYGEHERDARDVRACPTQ